MEKKYLSLYIDFKKQSHKLIDHIKSIQKRCDTLSQKDKIIIIEKVDDLEPNLKKRWKGAQEEGVSKNYPRNKIIFRDA